jgi:hypothetical protein
MAAEARRAVRRRERLSDSQGREDRYGESKPGWRARREARREAHKKTQERRKAERETRREQQKERSDRARERARERARAKRKAAHEAYKEGLIGKGTTHERPSTGAFPPTQISVGRYNVNWGPASASSTGIDPLLALQLKNAALFKQRMGTGGSGGGGGFTYGTAGLGALAASEASVLSGLG